MASTVSYLHHLSGDHDVVNDKLITDSLNSSTSLILGWTTRNTDRVSSGGSRCSGVLRRCKRTEDWNRACIWKNICHDKPKCTLGLY